MIDQPAFPALLQPAASALLAELSSNEHGPVRRWFEVLVQSEPLFVPWRIHVDAGHLRTVIARSHGDMRILALCLGTRHWNGHVREECLRQVVGEDRPWVVPFVVQLLGEYVIEIVDVIGAALTAGTIAPYAEFARENPAFMATTRRRVTSYWDAYHRQRFPTLRAYPAFVALEAIEGAALGATP